MGNEISYSNFNKVWFIPWIQSAMSYCYYVTKLSCFKSVVQCPLFFLSLLCSTTIFLSHSFICELHKTTVRYHYIFLVLSKNRNLEDQIATSSMDLVGCVLVVAAVGRSRCDLTGILEPQGAVPPGSNPPWRGWVYRLALEVPLFGGMLMGSRHFWNRLGYGPTPGLSKKKPCATLVWLVGWSTNITK